MSCLRCGGETKPGHRYCSPRCIGLTFGVKRVRPENVQGVCPSCQQTFDRKRQARDVGKYCSRECYFAQKTQRSLLQRAEAVCREMRERDWSCRGCGKWRYGVWSAYCGPECEKAKARRYYQETYKRKTQAGICPRCGCEWAKAGVQGRTVYCSRECSVKANRIPGSRRRRARHYGVKYQKIDARYVLERDGWKCHICGIRTPRRLRGTTEPRAPELDHVIPLAMGGPDTYDNLKCSCRACNQAKAAKWIGQRRLEFEAPTQG